MYVTSYRRRWRTRGALELPHGAEADREEEEAVRHRGDLAEGEPLFGLEDLERALPAKLPVGPGPPVAPLPVTRLEPDRPEIVLELPEAAADFERDLGLLGPAEAPRRDLQENGGFVGGEPGFAEKPPDSRDTGGAACVP